MSAKGIAGCKMNGTYTWIKTVWIEVVKLSARKSGECACGVRHIRRRTFHTTSPFNINLENCDDIMKGLVAQLETWKNEPITCDKCKGKAAA